MENLVYTEFKNIDLSDPFFDSLKEDYKEFGKWFEKKALTSDKAYILSDEGIQAFLYLKLEKEAITDVNPNLEPALRLKVGTFKVNPHGTRLGERFIKRIFDHAIKSGVSAIYVTAFEKHKQLINLLMAYGFERHGTKASENGQETVLLKNLERSSTGILMNYPRFSTKNHKKFLLAIYPEYHTRLFPDSILNNESFDIIQDVSHTNSIHKIYVTSMDVSGLNPGDLLVIYRTGDGQAPAHYRAVVTSVCVVEEVKSKNDFSSLADFLRYCETYSVFSADELAEWYRDKKRLYVIKMLYNAAFGRRLTRGNLIENIGLNPNLRWNYFQLPDSQFDAIIQQGGIHENLIID
ncbi:hypothetical protein GCM10010967_11810 [Dyadobacter beijingensis]|uniref:N-acetyltransferase n=1 Tax=Dyadobacter beijingensis TaxID=365489 RepID=A0ABQ2HIY3_9BACT|nr:hypothetical protein [Dyadobacter beijingensis]GGM81689.1 hypothetical protein GCM10010967_11810 [Dyadobacter beijingensis]